MGIHWQNALSGGLGLNINLLQYCQHRIVPGFWTIFFLQAHFDFPLA